MEIPEWFRAEQDEYEISANHARRKSAVAGIKKAQLLLAQGANETEIQAVLKQYPEIFGGNYRTGHGTWAFSELALPKEYRADWLTASGSSAGLMWELIELEDPQKIPFKKDGHFSESTRKGIEQIKDWRNYIQSNLDFATKQKSMHGLGLHDLRPRTRGIVVVGNSDVYSSEDNKSKFDENRKRSDEDERIEIVSYNSFLKSCLFQYTKPPLG